MKNQLTRFSLVLCALLALVTHVFASDPSVVAPARSPDYVARSGWVRPNTWNLSTGETSANALTYPIVCRAAGADAVDVVYRQKLQYRYVGEAYVSPFAPSPAVMNFNAWNAYFLAHDPHGFSGPMAFTNPDVPHNGCFNGVSAGGGGAFLTAMPGVPATLDQTITFQAGSQPGALTYRATDLQSWRDIDGYRGNRPLHKLWFTPVCDPAMSWHWWSAPPGTYSHMMSYGAEVLEQITLEVWEIRAGEPPLVPSPF